MTDNAAASPAAEGLPRLELVCFGAATARLDGRDAPADVVWRRHLALLVYLALSPGLTRSREHLIGLFWPESPEGRARHALNEALHRLRHSLGAARLQSRADAVRLSEAGLDVDALKFAAWAERDPARAVTLLRGDFLEGFALDEARPFEDWVAGERQRHRSRAVAVLVSHGEQRLTAGRFAEARDQAQRALALEPFAEPALRLALRAAALAGDLGGAFAMYHEFTARMETELGEPPSRDLIALGERIRRQGARPPPPGDAEPDPPLVGRVAAYGEVFRQLGAAMADGPRTVIVTAAHGMGRTRLVAECAARVGLEGATVARARPLESDHDAGLSTLRALLRAGLAQASGLVAADPDALGVLGWLVPELAGRATPSAPRDAAHLAAALAAGLAAVAGEHPMLLAVDDAHLADGATLEALSAALAQLHAAPVLLLLTAVERADPAPRELLRLGSEIGRRLPGASVRLDPLGEDDIRELVGSLAPWCQDDAERDRLARRLAFETGGNPFYAVTLLRGLQRLSTLRRDLVAWPPPHATLDTPLPFSIPSLVRTAIAVHVADLEPESRRVLSAASIGTLALDLDLITTLTELPRARVEECLAASERRHLVAFNGERYAFVAPLVAEVVRSECLTRGQRTSLRRRAIAVLASRQDLEALVLRAELMAHADPGTAAFEEGVAVARAALAAGATRTARRALAAAERAAGGAVEAQRPLLDALRAQLWQP
jgi:DNA-binding SARP family transcriptional activator